ncbi:MAG: FG-GAP repeat protein [Planctomycetes bacterium]|nr:FG-GAP repeat protein [Planctomycetota bacterium]
MNDRTLAAARPAPHAALRRRPRALPLAALLLGLAPASRAQLYEMAWSGDDGDYFGWSLATLGDLNGDGCDELAVGEPYWDSSSSTAAGRVTLLDGATATVLRTLDGTRPTALLGATLARVGDWTGDGVEDLVAGSPGLDLSLADVGGLALYSGATGNFIRSKNGSLASEALGGAIARVGDLDGDGVDELVAGVASLGEARLYDSAFNLLATVTGSSADSFGQQVAGLDDLDGDGVPEFAVAEPGYDSIVPLKFDRGRVLIYSGATRALLTSVQGLEAGDYFGQRIARLGDFDGDGVDEIAIASHFTDNVGTDNGQVRIFSGATRATLHTLDGAASGDSYGFSLARLGDLDHDGRDDFAVGILVGGANDLGAVEVRSGADAHLLWSVEGDSATLNWADERVGYSLAGGDWNGDGIGDLAYGDPLFSDFHPVGFSWTEPGRVERWLGAPAFAESYGAGWPGKNGIPALNALTPPAFGTTVIVAVGNSAGLPTTGLLLVGTSTAAIPWKDGTLLVNADLASAYFPIPTLGTFLSEDIPNDPALAFVDLYVQVVEADPAASKKLSFTPGLQLRLGYDLP